MIKPDARKHVIIQIATHDIDNDKRNENQSDNWNEKQNKKWKQKDHGKKEEQCSWVQNKQNWSEQ